MSKDLYYISKYLFLNRTNINSLLNEVDNIKIIKNLQKLFNQKNYLVPKEYKDIRAKAIKSLLKYNNIYHYSKKVFYLGVTYMDIIFPSLPKDIILNSHSEIYIINCIILAAKFYEDDLKSISFERFINLNNTDYKISINDIASNEVNCLKILNYKLDYYSIYDIISLLIFDYISKIPIKNFEFFCSVFNFPFNILDKIILSDIMINYSPIYIAFSLLYKTNINFNFEKDYFNNIKKKFSVEFSEFQNCLLNIEHILNLKDKIYDLNLNNIIQIKEDKEKINNENKQNFDVNKIYKYLINITNGK